MRITFIILGTDDGLLHIQYTSPDLPGVAARLSRPAPVVDGVLLEGAAFDAAIVESAPVHTLEGLFASKNAPTAELAGRSGGGEVNRNPVPVAPAAEVYQAVRV